MEDARSLDKDSAPKYTWTSVDSYALRYSVFSFICKPGFSFFYFKRPGPGQDSDTMDLHQSKEELVQSIF